MSMLADVNARITQAMKAHDAGTLSAMRMLKAALTNREIQKGQALDDAESIQVLASLIKQHRDSIEQFARGGRQDLVAREQAELTLLEALMPPPVSPAVIDEAVARAIAETGAASPRDMGRVMKAAMATLAGKGVDGKTVNEAVRKRLGA
ncbi:MAG TPA: GatB/YqeY domain-containing protein [Vicinamibacterales bacterium]|nr:GatB/YqeY domain-containing protein [Vicinamibacterales bacterium]HOG28323.1 GatB/YqeY domain-containing protein [Vicinamibacterales bacterium]HOQ60399.1 GatB/YqeY domain-containing protein [Vicinamibacterales bacterium]HPK70386.1 GatB/YqeY domain-containing protein [Vicinamibacterales bacterium]HPW20164.1 GatB/YqeY domain-containing protein [Vicinamibacterales bacterium]